MPPFRADEKEDVPDRGALNDRKREGSWRRHEGRRRNVLRRRGASSCFARATTSRREGTASTMKACASGFARGTALRTPGTAAGRERRVGFAPVEARKVLQGKVVSTKSAKTIVVAVTTYKQHPIYKKSMKSTKKYHAHDEEESAKEGDTVLVESSRPLSKLKRWRFVEVVNTNPISN